MVASRNRLSKLSTLLALAVGGGTLFSGCQTRIKEAFVGGTKDFLTTLLSPDNVELLLSGGVVEADEADGDT